MVVSHWMLCHLSNTDGRLRPSFTTYLTALCHFSPQEPVPEAAALLLRHPGLRFVWGHGSLLSDGGFPHPVRHVKKKKKKNLWNLFRPAPSSSQSLSFLVSSFPPFLHPEGGFPEREPWMSWLAIPINKNVRQQRYNLQNEGTNKSPQSHIFMFSRLFLFCRSFM